MKDFQPIPVGSSGQQWLDLGLVAGQDYVEFRVRLDRLHGAGNDRPWRVVTAHRVQCDPHELRLLLGYHLAPLIVAAVGADAVGQHRLLAPAAILDLEGLEVVVAAPLALPGV